MQPRSDEQKNKQKKSCLWRNQTDLEQIQPHQLSTASNWKLHKQREAEPSSSWDFEEQLGLQDADFTC